MEITQKEQEAWHAGIDAGREIERQNVSVAAQAQPAICGYTCTVPDDCETLHWRGQILSMNELASVAQPAVGEEIHVHIEGQDVLTLPLASSGMGAPRFVVHVPAQAQPVSGADGVPVGYIVHGQKTYLFVRGSDRPRLSHINGHDPVACVTPVFAAQPQPSWDAPLADDTRVGILADSSYINGLRTGYALGQAGNEAEFQQIITSTRALISEARADIKGQPSGSVGELPPLPEPGMTSLNYDDTLRWYTATQMREYARAALAAQASNETAIRDDLHLSLILDMYDNAMQKAFDGREFSNPCTPGTWEAKAWDKGKQEGQKKRAAGLPHSIAAQASGQDRVHAAIGNAFLVVLRDPAVSWRQTESWDFITRVAEESGGLIDDPAAIDAARAAAKEQS